jgi:predicted regulator of Ras-like GTPase activity (Roadblock/LC7/MglB family)
MSIDLSKASTIAGFIGACLVDLDTGLMLTSHGGGKIDLEAASALSTEIMKANALAIEGMKLDDQVEDMLVSMGKQIHIMRPMRANPGVFLYVVLERAKANLGMARLQVKALEGEVTF